MTATSSLLDRFDKIVDDFYGKVLSHPDLAPWFDGVPMDAQKKAFAAFVKMALTGWKGRMRGSGWKKHLRKAHAGLVERGLGDWHVTETVRLFAETLAEHGAPDDMIKGVGAWAETALGAVLGRS